MSLLITEGLGICAGGDPEERIDTGYDETLFLPVNCRPVTENSFQAVCTTTSINPATLYARELGEEVHIVEPQLPEMVYMTGPLDNV